SSSASGRRPACRRRWPRVLPRATTISKTCGAISRQAATVLPEDCASWAFPCSTRKAPISSMSTSSRSASTRTTKPSAAGWWPTTRLRRSRCRPSMRRTRSARWCGSVSPSATPPSMPRSTGWPARSSGRHDGNRFCLGDGVNRRSMMRRAFALCIVAAAALGLLVPAAPAQQKRINFYNWSDYIEPSVLKDFTKDTGIEVTYDTFDGNEVLETKLLAGKSGYDVVVPTAYFLERQIKAGVFQKLDKAKLPHLVNVWAEIASRLATYDPGNQYAVNYMWGTTGIGYNVKKARDLLAGGKVDSWDIVFNPDNLAKFKDCGIHMLDSADDVFPAALNHLGLNPNSKDPADLQKAADLVMKVRPLVRKFHSSEYFNALASGEICLVLGWSGDIKQAQRRAAEAKGGVEIGYSIPRE